MQHLSCCLPYNCGRLSVDGDHVFIGKFNERQTTSRSNGSVSYLPDGKHCRTADIVASAMASWTTQGN